MVSPKPKYMETHKDGQNFANDIFECIFLYFYENYSALIHKFILKDQIDNKPTFRQWHCTKQATSHYLTQWLYMCHSTLISRTECVKCSHVFQWTMVIEISHMFFIINFNIISCCQRWATWYQNLNSLVWVIFWEICLCLDHLYRQYSNIDISRKQSQFKNCFEVFILFHS